METKFVEKFKRLFQLSESQMAIVLGSSYIFCSLIGNVAATKVTYFAGLVMDAGFIYALTFTLRDLIHKNLGAKAAITTIWLSGILNLAAVIYFQIVIQMPAETSWAALGGQSAWQFLFGIQMRIVIASVVVQIFAESVDTSVYQKWITGVGAKLPEWTRVIASNAISIPIDSLLFPLIAFGGIVSSVAIWQMFYTNILVKTLSTIGFFWLIYLVPSKIIEVSVKKINRK